MPSPVVNVPNLTNGASTSTSTEIKPLVNGASGDKVARNGASPEKDNTRSPAAAAAAEDGKQKAKAVVAAAASEEPAQLLQSAQVSKNENSLSANGVRANGLLQTRKRSRDGELIRNKPRAVDGNIEPRTEEAQKEHLQQQYIGRYLRHDYFTCLDDQRRLDYANGVEEETQKWRRMVDARRRFPGELYGRGWAGYANGTQETYGQGTKIILPAYRKRPQNRESKPLHITRKDRDTQAEQLDELVPIRLDIEHDKYRIRDTFTWNLHDRVVPPDVFAQNLVEDFKIPLAQHKPLVDEIIRNMQEQIWDFHPHVYMDESPLDPHLPYNAYKNDDMRVVINLNITIGQNTLMDKFEWEINNPANSPEEFAQQMTRDLCLNGEFTTAIAHSIREQSQLFTKSLYVTGHPFDGRPVEDHELFSSFCSSPLTSTFRPFQTAKDFTPYLYELNEAELEKTELSLSREERRQKRSVNRRGGPALPDLKDRRRTNRTLLVSTVLPGAVENVEESRLLKKAAISTKGRRPGARDIGDESDESESEDSLPGSPAVGAHLLSGTARTRGMRGAASAAQVAMRSSNLARSATPDSMTSHHHEPRSARRVIRDDASSPEPQTSLIIKLKITKTKLQNLLRNQRARTKEMSQTPGPRPPSQNSTPGPGSMGPPPTSTPKQSNTNLPEQQTNGASAEKARPSTPSKAGLSASNGNSTSAPPAKHSGTSSLGRVDAVGTPGPDNPPPPPPSYLISALQTLQQKYPNDRFEGFMRYTAVSTVTDEPFTLPADRPTPPDTKFCYYPRIKCKDCPGKLYTPDVTLGVNNFEVHLKNRHHRDRVQKRIETERLKVGQGIKTDGDGDEKS